MSTLNPDEVVFVLPSHAPKGADDAYTVCTLVETVHKAAEEGQPKPPPTYELATTARSDVPAAVLERHLLREPPTHVLCTANRRLDVVVSIRSGACQALVFWETVLRPLLDLVGAAFGPDVGGQSGQSGTASVAPAVLVTESKDSVRQFARELWSGAEQQQQQHTIILLSGDGGVADLLNGINGDNDTAADDIDSTVGASQPPRPRPTIALLPLGTSNALFHSLHKSLYGDGSPDAGIAPIVLALRTLFRGATAPLPVFGAHFSPGARLVSYVEGQTAAESEVGWPPVRRLLGAIVASFGFHASIVWESDTPAYRAYGEKRFQMVAQELLREGHAYGAKVDVQPDPTSSRLLAAHSRDNKWGYVLATMVSNLERNFCISPAGRALDGQLRLVRFGPVDGARAMEIMMAAYDAGKHVHMRWKTGSRNDGKDKQSEKGGGKEEEEEEEDGVGYDEINSVKVTVDDEDPRWRKACVDGTIVDIPRGGWMEVRQAATSPFDILIAGKVLADLAE